MARTNKKGGNTAGLKGWSAFTNAEKNLDNTSKPDGRAGSSAYQIANQYRRHKVSKVDNANAKARWAKAQRDNPDASPSSLQGHARKLEHSGYGVKDEFKRVAKKMGSFVGKKK
jgi:hypothetical protein